MLGDIMKETGIKREIVEKEKIVIPVKEEIKPIIEPIIEETIKEEKLIEPIKIEQEIAFPVQEVKEVESVVLKPVMSLSQLKEKSFDEIKQDLSQDKNKNNQSNVLKAGEVIKL